uniref:Malonyl-CoA decarboxylase C-terminal domain-containing protein n=1 Tax=Aegilops tauschii subsp. strangulata TaxID=200361 RepID=A0A453KRQ9_AEGTS
MCTVLLNIVNPGLSGINLGKFLLKRVIDMLRKDMPSVQIFATLSPIPGFMQWLLAKLASQIKLAETEMQEGNLIEGASSTFRESILFPEEEKMIHSAIDQINGKQGIELLQDILKSSQWVKSDKLSAALKSPLMRLCTRYVKRHIGIWECYQRLEFNTIHSLNGWNIICYQLQKLTAFSYGV